MCISHWIFLVQPKETTKVRFIFKSCCNFELPSEEGQEHNNKKLRFNREHHSRKSCVTKGLQDIFMHSTYASDPKILSILEESLTKSRSPEMPMSQEVIDMLDD